MSRTGEGGFTNLLREILISYKHDHIRLGEAMREVKDLCYDKRDEFIWDGRMKQNVHHKILKDRGELE